MKLTGPEYLLFYLMFATGLILVLRFLRYFFEGGQAAKADPRDPYRLALLRDGLRGAIELAVVRLVDSGHLVSTQLQVACVNPALPPPLHGFERLVLLAVAARGWCSGHDLASSAALRGWQRETRASLREEGLLAGPQEWLVRGLLAALGAGLLIWAAASRLADAYDAGRHNTGLLEFLLVAAPLVAALIVLLPERTRQGARVLADLRELLHHVPRVGSASPSGKISAELLLVGAVFGTSAFAPLGVAAPASLFRFGGGASWTSSGGSSCGASCGSGGGCGGGCGGCGS